MVSPVTRTNKDISILSQESNNLKWHFDKAIREDEVIFKFQKK